MKEHTQEDLAEWAAYFKTQDENWIKRYNATEGFDADELHRSIANSFGVSV